MLNQIHSLPGLAREMLPKLDESVRQAFDHKTSLSLKRLYVTGCGDSHHSAVGTELAFEALAGIPTEALTALQFARYTAPFLPQTEPGTNVVIGISVSGEVSRTLEALQQGSAFGATPISLCGTPGSRIYQASERVIDSAGPDFPDPPGVHTPGVRSYTTNQLALLLAAIRIGEVRGQITSALASEYRAMLMRLPDLMEETIAACDRPARELAEQWREATEFVFVGGGPNFATAMFSAAKVLEASGDAAMAQDTEEWAHLQYFAQTGPTPTFFISTGERDRSRMAEVAVAARTIGRRTCAVAPRSFRELDGVVDHWLPLPENLPEMFSAPVACIPGELFAAHRSDVTGEPFFRAFGGGRSQEGGGGISRIRTSELLGERAE